MLFYTVYFTFYILIHIRYFIIKKNTTKQIPTVTILKTLYLQKFSQANYYKCWGEVMEKIGADKTPHEARHTFETLLDNAKGNRKCIDMLMGHKSKDVGNRVYNHKTIEQLRDTIALLK